MTKNDKFKLDGVIVDWNDELLKIAALDIELALEKANPDDRDRLTRLAIKTLKLVGT